MSDYRYITIEIPDSAAFVLTLLEQAGFEAWCVGGFVRDALMGYPCKDIDIASSALWQESKTLLEEQGIRVYETGAKHGTITAVVDNNPIEITSYRIDGCYSDSRHPDEVTFTTSIKDDLARRDFCMNALAYHPKRGLFDPFKGQEDISQKIIRTVGDANTRFSEDALRILRACRFKSQLGFSFEARTKKALFENAADLRKVSVERLARELELFICGSSIHDALLESFEIIAELIPELSPMKGFDQRTPYHIYDVLEHTAYCMQFSSATPLLRWAALFHDIGKPEAFFTDSKGIGHFYGHEDISVELADGVMNRLRLRSSMRHDILLLIKHHDDTIEARPKAVKRALRNLEGRVDLFKALCNLKQADARAQAPGSFERVELAHELERILDEILAKEEAFSLKDLAIDGNDILALGIMPGPKVAALLNKALEAVINEEIPNEHEALLRYLQQI